MASAPPLLPAGAPARQPGGDGTLPLAKIIAAELAQHTAAMQRVLAETQQLRRLSRVHASTLGNAIAATHRLARDSWQIGRLASGEVQLLPERLNLDVLVSSVLQDMHALFHASGVELQSSLQPMEVVLDRSLLAGLLEAAIGWSSARGRRIQVWLRVRGGPGHALLTLRSSQPGMAAAAANALGAQGGTESLQWHLLLQLAHALDVALDRSDIAGESILTIEFPGPARQPEGPQPQARAAAPLPGAGSQPLAGCRLLLVTADAQVRGDVEAACTSMALLLRVTADSRQAVHACRLEPPQLVLVDERLHDEHLQALRTSLLRRGMDIPFVGIADAGNVLELAGWAGDAMSRVSRDVLRGQLPGVLVMELARVF